MYCYICGRRRVAVARYRMICLVLLTELIISLFWLIGHQKVLVMLQPTQRKMPQQQKKILQREPLSNDSQATDDARTAENQGNHWYRLTGNRRLKIKATTDIDLQATDDARTAENQGNHWYRLTGNRRCQNSWKSRQPLISTYRQQTMPEQLKIKATTDIDLQATDDDRTAENQGNNWYRLTGNRRCQNSWKSRQPLISTYRQQTMTEQLKIKATTDIDLQTKDDDRTVEKEGNHWYRLTGNRRWQNSWKSRQPLISTYRQQTIPQLLKISNNYWYRLTCNRRRQNSWKYQGTCQSNVCLLWIITFEPCEIEIWYLTCILNESSPFSDLVTLIMNFMLEIVVATLGIMSHKHILFEFNFGLFLGKAFCKSVKMNILVHVKQK